MTEISGAGALPAFRAATQSPSTIQPQSMHYARPSAAPAAPGRPQDTEGRGAAKPDQDDASPRRVDITV